MLLNIAVFIIAFYILAISSLVLMRNRNSKINISFSIFSGLVGIWIIANYLGANFKHYAWASIFIRADLFTGTFLALSFWWFSSILSQQAGVAKRKWVAIILAIFAVSSSLMSLSGSVAAITKGRDGLLKINYGSLYTTYSVILAGITLFGYILLLIAHRRSKGGLKSQITLMLQAMGVAVVFVLVPNLLVPQITKDIKINLFIGNLAYVGLAIFISLTSYAIVKHKLFDLRLIVARSLGYILTLSTLIGIYVLTIFGISNSLLGTPTLTGFQQVLYVGATLVFGFSLPPLKRFFDKLTNRLFYRDAYDAQVLLDRFNKILVGNIELDTILKQSADIIATTVKADFAAFLIRETEGTSRRASYSKIVELNTEHILSLKGKTKGKTELYVADEIEDEHDKYKMVFNENNIAIAARLAGSGDIGEQGFLLLGPKQSGNPYNKQDLQVLDIISNELVIAIQNALRFEEIETFNITLQQKVNDATKQLRQTNEKLKALDETKDEFISMASHQLRTPLTAVKGYVSMVVEGDAGKLNKQQKELLDQAFASSQRMVYLIADLLNVSRLRSGKFVIENKPTQLADVVESEMEQLTDMANSKQQTLTYVKPANFPALNMDETKIRQVIMNFADNALHYTPNGGHIQIHLEDKGDTIQYTVVDDGLGVPKAEQHHLFTKFYRAGNAKKARPDGTGLGLFMAKKVVAAQGGSIIFNSEENKGSTFGFIFPKAKMLVKETAKLADSKKVEKDVTPKTKA